MIFILPCCGSDIKKEDLIALKIDDRNIGYATILKVFKDKVLADVDKKASDVLMSYNKNENYKLTLM